MTFNLFLSQFCPPTNQCTGFLSRASVDDQTNTREVTVAQPVAAAAPIKPAPALVKVKPYSPIPMMSFPACVYFLIIDSGQ